MATGEDVLKLLEQVDANMAAYMDSLIVKGNAAKAAHDEDDTNIAPLMELSELTYELQGADRTRDIFRATVAKWIDQVREGVEDE